MKKYGVKSLPAPGVRMVDYFSKLLLIANPDDATAEQRSYIGTPRKLDHHFLARPTPLANSTSPRALQSSSSILPPAWKEALPALELPSRVRIASNPPKRVSPRSPRFSPRKSPQRLRVAPPSASHETPLSAFDRIAEASHIMPKVSAGRRVEARRTPRFATQSTDADHTTQNQSMSPAETARE
jgi:hypothetical protein